jgi:hypothetical protein
VRPGSNNTSATGVHTHPAWASGRHHYSQPRCRHQQHRLSDGRLEGAGPARVPACSRCDLLCSQTAPFRAAERCPRPASLTCLAGRLNSQQDRGLTGKEGLRLYCACIHTLNNPEQLGGPGAPACSAPAPRRQRRRAAGACVRRSVSPSSERRSQAGLSHRGTLASRRPTSAAPSSAACCPRRCCWQLRSCSCCLLSYGTSPAYCATKFKWSTVCDAASCGRKLICSMCWLRLLPCLSE